MYHPYFTWTNNPTAPVVVADIPLQGGGDDDVDDFIARGGRPKSPQERKRDTERIAKASEAAYAQALERVPPDLRPVEKAMLRLGAKPVATVKGKDIAGPAIIGDAATNAAMQQMAEEEELILLMLS